MSFFKPSPPPKVEPPPTRETAANAVDDRDKAESLRRAKLVGATSTQLTGSYGVPTELTGTRSLANG